MCGEIGEAALLVLLHGSAPTVRSEVGRAILLAGVWLLFSAVLIWAFLLLVLKLQATEDRQPSVSPPTGPVRSPPIWGLVAAYIAVLSVLVGITLVGLIWTSS